MGPIRLILGHVQQTIGRNILRCFASVDYSPAHSREKVNQGTGDITRLARSRCGSCFNHGHTMLSFQSFPRCLWNTHSVVGAFSNQHVLIFPHTYFLCKERSRANSDFARPSGTRQKEKSYNQTVARQQNLEGLHQIHQTLLEGSIKHVCQPIDWI